MRNMMKILVSLLVLLVAGCKVQETTTNRISTSTHHAGVLVDSIALRDSIIIRERCDTVFFTKYSTLSKERLRIDTIIKCDTVYAERVVTVKERNSSGLLWWLLVPVIAVLWKVGLFDLLRKLIIKK